MLNRITPVVLTLDEEANIGRTLDATAWARRVVVVDSGSSDATEAIVRRHPNAVFVRRAFDSHAAQWGFAVAATGIDTEWVLALDADYVLTPALVEELRRLEPGPGVDGYRARFRYCIGGRPLRGSLYPAVTVLFRREQARYVQDGHTQRVAVPGQVRELRSPILHDDRKPFSRFVASQRRYMAQEAALVASRRFGQLRWPDRVRKLRVIAPLAVLGHCLLVRGLLLDGRRGLRYALQRFVAEAILSRELLRRDLGLRPRGATGAGGCAMNSVANGKVFGRTDFRDLYVQSAAGDAGGAIGAALHLWHEAGGRPRVFAMDHAYYGPAFDDARVGAVLAARAGDLAAAGCSVAPRLADEALCARVASAIADGKVVGWFQGRMEWGPRALGNRSILADPRRPDMKELLNRKIKRRESFRPFAPSVLRERVAAWFETDYDVPFMLQVFPIRAEKRALVPAVTHVDGTGRLQTVTAAQNPLYHMLIAAFERETGVPMLLNTSFNENEPVVCRPEEALECFLRTRMDLLVLGGRVVERGAA